jgi:hypothetical protein
VVPGYPLQSLTLDYYVLLIPFFVLCIFPFLFAGQPKPLRRCILGTIEHYFFVQRVFD